MFICLTIAGCGGSDSVSASGGDAAAENCPWGGVTNGRAYYDSKAKAFVGLNPRDGLGSGHALKRDALVAETYGTAPDTNGREPKTRTDMCTCDCKGSDDGVGCVGFGGIAFRYLSVLRSPGETCSAPWKGKMVSADCGAALGGRCNTSNPDQNYFQFIGEDLRESPGGAAVYSVSTLLPLTGDVLIGSFRQANSKVSCKAGLQDKDDFVNERKEGKDSCYYKCGTEGSYAAWLEYCAKSEDTSVDTGFSGWEKPSGVVV